jgi:hypothetical protein
MGITLMRKAVMGVGVPTGPRPSGRHASPTVLLLFAAAGCGSTFANAAEVLTSPAAAEETSTVATPPNARGSGAAAVKVPMPPTNLRVVDGPVTELVDRVFQRIGYSKETRSVLVDAMQDLSNGDLTYLAKGSDPASLGLAPPEPFITEEWQRLVQAYAEAAIADRKERSDFFSQLTVGVVLAVISLPLTFLGGMWVARHKTKTSPASQAQSQSEQLPKNHAKRRRQRKGR